MKQKMFLLLILVVGLIAIFSYKMYFPGNSTNENTSAA